MSVRIKCLSCDSIGDFVSQNVFHPSSVATVVTVAARAIKDLLDAETNFGIESGVFDEIGALKSSICGEGVTASTGALVANCSHHSCGTPIHIN